jgi:hypothetical protein
VIGEAIGQPGDRDEAHLARRLLNLLHPGMLLLADQAFDSATFLAGADRRARNCWSVAARAANPRAPGKFGFHRR